MTLGEKIVHLRIVNGISQEKFAKMIEVSRQAVSKWESDESLPQIDVVVRIASLFNVTCDELLKDDIVIHKGKNIPLNVSGNEKTKYFGTDGFRGEVNKVLTADQAYKIGRFLGWFYSSPKFSMQRQGYRPRIVIGKDTRRSSYMLEYAVAAGLAASGADVYLLHVTTTPSVSYIIRKDGFDCGIMITASHNPFYDNGIKVLNCYGEKIDDSVALYIEAYLDHDLERFELEGDDLPFATKENIGRIIDYSSGRNRYIAYLIGLAKNSMKDLKIALDCANGASWMIAKSVFDALGAQTFVINNTPNGLNVNMNAGSTHIENLCSYVKENKCDMGFAFDGDADRCIAVDENGKEIDGDKILYVLANMLKEEGSLKENTIVATIMSNSGLTKALKSIGVKQETTNVGDRYVLERMQEKGCMLGGEQSGHIIIKKYATTGDGILTAIMLTDYVLDKKSTLGKLASPVKLLPQKMRNVRVTSKQATMEDEVVLAKYKELQDEIGDDGRILLRQSGTEPVIRIMVELDTVEQCEAYIEKMYQAIKRRGFVCE